MPKNIKGLGNHHTPPQKEKYTGVKRLPTANTQVREMAQWVELVLQAQRPEFHPQNLCL